MKLAASSRIKATETLSRQQIVALQVKAAKLHQRIARALAALKSPQ